MSVAKQLAHEKSQRGKGSNFKTTTASPWKSKSTERVSINEVNSAVLHDAISAAIEARALISFNSTRDGGSVRISILDGQEKHETYCSSVMELEEALVELVVFLQTKDKS